MLATVNGQPVPNERFAAIPVELRAYQSWVCWRYEQRGDGKPTKMPVDPKTGYVASVTSPTTWASFDNAVAASARYDGIGFVLTEHDPYTIIDIDATDDPSIVAQQETIVAAFDSYSERSPSKTGLHIIVKGKLKSGRRRSKIELYYDKRYMTMTGDVFEAKPIAERQPLLDQLWHEMGGDKSDVVHIDLPDVPEHIADAVVLATLSPAMRALFDVGHPADTDNSANDQALLNALAPRTGWSRAHCERLFLASALGQRGKVRDRADYRAWTIARAFDGMPAPAMSFDGMTTGGAIWQGAPLETQNRTWPLPTLITNDEFSLARIAPQAIIERFMYADVGVTIAAGGVGKTTLALWLAIHIVLGIPFAGRGVHRPGYVVFVTGEDTREILVARLRSIVAEMFPFGATEFAEREAIIARIRTGIVIIDVSAGVVRLTGINRDTVIVDNAAVDSLGAALEAFSPSLVIIDPAISFGVGEARVNDAEQALVQAGRRLRARLNCAIMFIHHSGKENARNATTDQYSGRGGSAFPDGSRMVFVLNRLEPNEWAKETGEALEPGESGIRLNIAKLSYCGPQAPIFIRRKGYRFDAVSPQRQSDEETIIAEAEQAFTFIGKAVQNGVTHSRKTLEDEDTGLSRAKLRRAIKRLIDTSRLVEVADAGKSVQLVPATLPDANGEGA